MISNLVALVFGTLAGTTVGIMIGSWLERSNQLDRLIAQQDFTGDMSD